MNQYSKQDPRSQYDSMEIPEQLQEEPGLDSLLKPLADHGLESYQGTSKLKGRKALVTGGDSGIGRAVVIAFAREGADVVFTHLPSEAEDASQLLESLKHEGVTVTAISADFTKEEQVRNAVKEAVDTIGGLDIIVNNAGRQLYQQDIVDISSEQLRDTFTVNILAMFWIVQEAMKHINAGTSIINTTSIQATQPSPGLLDYASTKGAITTFTRGLAQQLTPKGIRVNAVAPGPIWTPLQPSYGQPEEKLVEFGKDTPLGRAGQPAELAPLYVFLASQESSYVSGEVLGATGGKLR